MRIRRDLLGQRFGRLIVDRALSVDRGDTRWACTCDCGRATESAGRHLVSGNKKSCGCLQIEAGAKTRRHGHSADGKISPTYRSWVAMKDRCARPTNPDYANYGGRGIVVCDRWLTFEEFLADMGERPKGTTLDRFPDRDGNYEPGNCRWATITQQNRNTRSNRTITVNGVAMTVAEAAEHFGIASGTIFHRLRAGWSQTDAATRPVHV